MGKLYGKREKMETFFSIRNFITKTCKSINSLYTQGEYWQLILKIFFMKIKDIDQKKRVSNRLRRIEGQLRGIIQMIEDEAGVREIIQQLSAVRSALGQAINEEILCAIEKSSSKNNLIAEKDMEEIRDFLKIMR